MSGPIAKLMALADVASLLLSCIRSDACSPLYSLYMLYLTSLMMTSTFMMFLPGAKQMQLLLNVGGPDRVSRLQMAEAVAHIRGYDTSLIKPVSASLVCISSLPSAFLSMSYFLGIRYPCTSRC